MIVAPEMESMNGDDDDDMTRVRFHVRDFGAGVALLTDDPSAECQDLEKDKEYAYVNFELRFRRLLGGRKHELRRTGENIQWPQSQQQRNTLHIDL